MVNPLMTSDPIPVISPVLSGTATPADSSENNLLLALCVCSPVLTVR